MTTTIDTNEALDLLTRAVKEKGEGYIYPEAGDIFTTGSCVYVKNGAPSCIVGHVVNYINPKLLPQIGEWEQTQFADEYPETGVDSLQFLLADNGVRLTEDAVSVLARAQDLQDGGEPWGEAVRKAREYVR